MGNERERIKAGKNNRIASKNEVHWVDATLSPAVCKSLSDCDCLLSRVPKARDLKGNQGKVHRADATEIWETSNRHDLR